MKETIRIYIESSSSGDWTAQVEGAPRLYHAAARYEPRDLAASAALNHSGFPSCNVGFAQDTAREFGFRLRHINSDQDEELFEADINDDWRKRYAPQT
jgi:hypothetical protein